MANGNEKWYYLRVFRGFDSVKNGKFDEGVKNSLFRFMENKTLKSKISEILTARRFEENGCGYYKADDGDIFIKMKYDVSDEDIIINTRGVVCHPPKELSDDDVAKIEMGREKGHYNSHKV